ncbi:hypothetical protein GCM10009530_15430 [Microbispora corallina]|uniref:DUF5753 domain-containing protein n=1 Tax=Microbispora corallina TaxID=83302 RepID=A0ABQ4FXH5_9ACTN|nr:hypothetical protein Mco01_25010 [Microbispora corallina]
MDARNADLIGAPCRIRTCVPGSGEGYGFHPHKGLDLLLRAQDAQAVVFLARNWPMSQSHLIILEKYEKSMK